MYPEYIPIEPDADDTDGLAVLVDDHSDDLIIDDLINDWIREDRYLFPDKNSTYYR
jgi:hypothetical protein